MEAFILGEEERSALRDPARSFFQPLPNATKKLFQRYTVKMGAKNSPSWAEWNLRVSASARNVIQNHRNLGLYVEPD